MSKDERGVCLSGMRARIHPFLDSTDPPATVKKGTFPLLLNADHTEAVTDPVVVLVQCGGGGRESLVSVDVVPLERRGQMTDRERLHSTTIQDVNICHKKLKKKLC